MGIPTDPSTQGDDDRGGKWFLTSEPFLRWQEGVDRFMWCSGLPGVGKTILASIVEDHLRGQQPAPENEGGVGIATLYFKYDDPRHPLGYVLKAILEQLVEGRPDVPKPLTELLERHHLAPTSTISAALYSTIETYSKVFIIADAIDECSAETRRGLIETLRGLPPKVHVLVTSHPLLPIELDLEGFQRVEITANRDDVELFIDQQILKNDGLRKVVEESPELRNEIKRDVVDAAGDIFLLARLVMESLVAAAALSPNHVRVKLQNLPTSLEEAYDDVMERISSLEPEDRGIAFKALAWIAHAYRPLSLKELQHAVAVEPYDTHLDEGRILAGDKIIALCSGLAIVSPAGVASFVHGSVVSYVETHRQDSFLKHNTRIAFSCAAYLNGLKDVSSKEILEKYPLAIYAAHHMEDHADPLEAPEGTLYEVLCEFLSHSGARKDLLSLLDGLDVIECEHCPPPNGEVNPSAQGETAPAKACRGHHHFGALEFAASMGLAHVVTVLLNETVDIGTLNKHTLDIAVERGFARAIEFLVGSGARVDLKDDHGVQVLLAITARDWHAAADIIAQKAKLAASEDVSEVSRDRVQLLIAAYYGDDSDADRLVARRNIDFIGEGYDTGATALFLAVERNHPQMVQILLSAGVDITATDNIGQTALHRAVRRGREVLVRQLLWNDADVDIKDDEGKTAWSSNAHALNEKILGFLLDAGADPNTTGPEGESVLYSAAAAGNEELVRYSIKSGANPSIKTKYKWAPLHWAAAGGYTECVKLLIEAGAELSPISDQLVTPLDLAIEAGHEELAEFLIEKGAQRALDVPNEDVAPIKEKHLEDLASANAANTDSEAKTTLAFDRPLDISLPFGQFIYHTNKQGINYQISHPLDTKESDAIRIRHSETRANSSEYPLPASLFNTADTLYEIQSTRRDFAELSLRSGSNTSPDQPPNLIMRMTHAGNWEVIDTLTGELALRATTPDWSRAEDTQGWRWLSPQGKVVARMGGGWAPPLTLERGLDAHTQDLLVASYVAKIWSDTVVMQRWYGGSSSCCSSCPCSH